MTTVDCVSVCAYVQLVCGGDTSRNAPPHVLAMCPWMPLLRGFWVVILGEITLLMPDMTLKILAILFGIYALVDGTLALVLAIRPPGVRPSWWLALIGICGILAGIVALLWPGLSTYAFAGCIAVWAIIVGSCEFAGAVALRKLVPNEWFCILSGAAAIIFGLMLMSRSDEGTLALVWLIGVLPSSSASCRWRRLTSSACTSLAAPKASS
jgi:uncharacterized membrane protein HdeD (DUF308 family)